MVVENYAVTARSLTSAKSIQEGLRQLANDSDITTASGLRDALKETTLSLLRKPELWVYEDVETKTVLFNLPNRHSKGFV